MCVHERTFLEISCIDGVAVDEMNDDTFAHEFSTVGSEQVSHSWFRFVSCKWKS